LSADFIQQGNFVIIKGMGFFFIDQDEVAEYFVIKDEWGNGQRQGPAFEKAFNRAAIGMGW